MDGPDDELMGGYSSSSPPRTNSSARNVVTPPLPRSPRRSSSGSAPPANAFVHTSAGDRWSQYERSSKLQQESAQAHANAVASAAERAASLDTDYDDLPPHERVRAEALAVLEKAGDDVSPYQLRQTMSGGLTTGKTEPYSFKRSASSGVEARNSRTEPYSFRSSSGGDVSAERTKRRPPAALAGLDLKTAAPTRSDARKWTISDDDDLGLEDEEDLVEVVDMENRTMGGRSSGIFSGNGGYTDNPSANPSNWSSRYSVNPYLSGGVASKNMLEMDKDEQRIAKSARNMFMTSTPSTPSSPSTNIFGSGFTFRKNEPPPREYNLKTVWSDNDPLTSNGNSLDPPIHQYTSGISKARRRRRIWVYSVLAVCAIAVIAGTSKRFKSKQAAPSVVGGSAGEGTTFYVMADTPYDAEEGTKLSSDLEALPGDADFVVHLGNIQDASTTLCSEYSYEEASAVLKKSPAPIFVLPGENDWNNCPDPDKAWDDWSTYFMKFEKNFYPPFTVLRQSGEIENFSFLYDGVLFVGLHLVGGRIPDQGDWDDLLTMNVKWVEENFNKIFNDADYRAVVLLGNARPSNQQRDFFNKIVNTIRSMGKPTLYIHANPEGGSKFVEYRPFGDADNLNAVQLEDGGRSPPLRVSIGSGSRPFALG